MALANPKYAFKYLVGGSIDAKRDSLVEGGTLIVGQNHWLKTARSSLCSVPHGASAEYEYALHHLEYIWLDVFEWGDDVLARGMVWFLLPEKPSRFLAKADDMDLLKWEAFDTCRLAAHAICALLSACLPWVTPQVCNPEC